MKRHNYLFLAALLGAILVQGTACETSTAARAAGHLDEATKAIAESNAIYFEAFAQGDSSLFIDRYAEDCCILAPDTEPLCGPIAPLEFFRIAYHEIGLRNGKFITTAIYGDGLEFVTEEGRWQSIDINGKQFDDGKFLVLWKKTPRGWKMFRDAFSSNRKKQ